jgi:hypothetical protein
MNIFTIRLKAAIIYVGVFICAILFCGLILSDGSIMTVAKEKILPIYNVERTDKKIAISFDAAWGDVIKRTSINSI